MNSTAQLARDPQAHLPTGPTLVASRSARTAAPGAWSPTDRWAWAAGLPVSGIARAVAGCIARHANDQTGLGWPGMGTIATETGFCRRAVVKAIKELERGEHFTVGRFKVGKKNTSNRYQLPPMGGAPAALGGGGGSAPDALGGSAPGAPESVSIESVQEPVSSSRARVVCEICGNDWPAEYGTTCYKCGQTPSTGTPGDDNPTEPKDCTCGDAYRQSYGRRCVDCKGEPSAAQRDALRPAQAASTPPRAETETRQPQEPENDIPPDGGEGQDKPQPKSDPDALLRFWEKARADFNNRKQHMGETDDGQTDDRTEASGQDGETDYGRGADGVDHSRGQRAPGSGQEATRGPKPRAGCQYRDAARALPQAATGRAS